MSPQDKVTLSVRERQELAKLQSMLETADPDLAKKLAHRVHMGGARRKQLAVSARHRLSQLSASRWAGPVLAIAGLSLVVAMVSWVVWAAIPAALVAAAGIAICLSHAEARAAARRGDTSRERRTGGGDEGDDATLS